MNNGVNKLAAVIAFLAVSLCAGCNGNTAATTTSAATETSTTSVVTTTTTTTTTTAASPVSVSESDVVEDDVEPDDSEVGESHANEDEVTDDDMNGNADMASELVSVLQRDGQLIYSDDYCQIRYFGEMKADNGEAVIVLGYSKFHGGLVRILNNGFRCGDIVDGGALWFSPMNTFTDGYWCHSGAHGWEFYDDPSEQWWTDNEFICLRCPSGGTEVDTEEKAGYAEYAAVQGKFMMYDDSVYDGVSKLGLYLTDLRIQEAVEGNFETKEPPYFAEPSNENVHVCTSEYDTKVIRVRFDPEKADQWAHT